ncbi:MAG: adenosine deaminase [Candidatus Sericytochromatia bacterium]|uniref:adenosine deaminase n=1 Tax=Candidatus Tanganyikabacteria bacterium TaxID=2961651 RepID=A0A938BK36_9BACT|nr:adenosine deaminase [Candidatus Tanganyikabacteria bacterium]
MDIGLYPYLPKTDLHLHLDGAARPDTIREFALAQGITPENIEPHLRVGTPGTLAEYLAHFRFVLPLMQTREALSRIAYEIVEDAQLHSAAYIEIRFCPLLVLEGGLSGEEAVNAVIEGIAAAQEDLGGILGRVVLCALQGQGREEAERVVDLALNFQISGVVGVDVAGDESGRWNLEPFVAPFRRAKDGGLRITCHAGENGPPEHIIEAIELLGAQRIGHGTSVLGSQRAIELARERNVGFECCPTSNVQTGAVTSYAEHPLRRMLAAGLACTINTDNPLFSETDIENEWNLAIDEIGLTAEECAIVLANGFSQMFLEDAPAPVRNVR